MKKQNTYIAVIAVLCVIAMLLAGVIIGFIISRKGITRIVEKEEAKPYAVCYDETFDVALTQITLKTDAGNMTVLPSEDGKTRLVIRADEKRTRVTQTADILTAIANTDGKRHFGINTKEKPLVEITLYLPADFSGTLTANSKYGSLQTDAFSQMTLEFKSDYGDLNAVAVNRLEADCDYGNIQIDTVGSYLNIKADFGSVRIETLTLNEDSSIECDAGSVHIQNAANAHIKAETEVGSVKVRPDPADAGATLFIETSAGSITVE